MAKVKIKLPYEARERVSIQFLEEDGTQALGLTKQCFKDECDVLNIISRHDRTGLIDHVNNAVAQYGDYSEINEYRESLDLVMQAQQSFGEIPSNIREMFNNDPGSFFEFATNPENHEKMAELGLAEARPEIEKPSKASSKNSGGQASESAAENQARTEPQKTT